MFVLLFFCCCFGEKGLFLRPVHRMCNINWVYIVTCDMLLFFLFFFFKKQPYIPSRKAVHVVEHVKKRTKHVGKKGKHSKTKKKKLSAPGFEPGSPKLPRVGKGSSIT